MWTWLRKRFGKTAEEPRKPTPAEIRKEEVTKYFKPTPDQADQVTAYKFLASGGFFVLFGLALLAVGAPALAVPVLLIGILVVLHGWERLALYRRDHAAAEPKPTDRKMDDYLEGDLAAVATHALKRLGLTEADLELTSEQADPTRARLADQGSGPLTVFGPVVTSKKRIGKEKENVWRFSAYEVMVICPTRDHLGIFECTIDLHTGGKRDEEVREYYYSDVAMVALVNRPPTELALHPLDRDGSSRAFINKIALCELQIAASSGDRSTIVAGVNPTGPRRTVTLLESRLDRVVDALRRLLRHKKRWAS
jgi:hypothetical protein